MCANLQRSWNEGKLDKALDFGFKLNYTVFKKKKCWESHGKVHYLRSNNCFTLQILN